MQDELCSPHRMARGGFFRDCKPSAGRAHAFLPAFWESPATPVREGWTEWNEWNQEGETRHRYSRVRNSSITCRKWLHVRPQEVRAWVSVLAVIVLLCVYLRMGHCFHLFYLSMVTRTGPAQGTSAAVLKPWLKACPAVGGEALRKVESLWAGNGEGLNSASAREAGKGCGTWLYSLPTLHKNLEPDIFMSIGGGNKGELWRIKQFFLLKWL